MKVLWIILEIILITLSSSLAPFQVEETQVQSIKCIKDPLGMTICYERYLILIIYNLDGNIYPKVITENEALIYFDGVPYIDGSIIPFNPGTYTLRAWFNDDWEFSEWGANGGIIIENKTAVSTRVRLVDCPITTGQVGYCTIFLYLRLKNIPLPDNFSWIYYGKLKNDLIIKNAMNNKSNLKFLPYEKIKIDVIAYINENKPYATNPINAFTYISLLNSIKINNYGFSIKNKEVLQKTNELNQKIIKKYSGLLDLKGNITISYPNSNYELGFSNLRGTASIISTTLVNITWVWDEIRGDTIIHNRVTKILDGAVTKTIYVSSIFPELENIYDLGDSFLIKLKLFWIEDLGEVLNKTDLIAGYVREMKKSTGVSDDKGYLNITIQKKELERYLLGTYGYINVDLQFKDNAPIIGAQSLLIRWSKLASLVLKNSPEEIRIKIVKLNEFMPVRNAKVELIIDGKIVKSVVTNYDGIAYFYLGNISYKKIEIKVRVYESKEILLSSNFSDIIIYTKLYP